MATTGKKEYTLKINGVDKAVKDFTTLEAAVKSFDSALEKDRAIVTASTKVTQEKARALTDEEKAEKKLAETIDKVVQARTEANRAQIDANQAARDAQRQAVLEQQAANASANSIESMRAQLSLLKNEWKDLDVGSERFKELTAETAALTNKLKEAEAATGDFRRNVGNYPDAMAGLEKLSGGIEGVSKSSMGMAQSMLATNQLMGIFGNNSEENAKQAQQLQKILTTLSVIQGVNTNLLKNNAFVSGVANIADKARAMQLRVKTALTVKDTAATGANTVAQLALNAAVKSFPLFFIAAAIATVIGLLTSYKGSTDDAASSQAGLNRELERTNTLIEDNRYYYDLEARRAKARGESEEEIYHIRKEGAEKEIKLAKESRDEVKKVYDASDSEGKKALQESLDERNKAVRTANDRLTQIEHDEEIDRLQSATDAERKRKEDAERAGKDAADRRNKETEDKKAALEKERDLTRKAEDDITSLKADEFERRRAEVDARYARQREDLQRQLDTDTSLTQKGRDAIGEVIRNIDAHISADRDKIRQDELKKEEEAADELKAIRDNQIADADRRNGLLLSRLDIALEQAKQKIGDLVVRDEGGLQLINVEATRANLQASNKILDDYTAGVRLALNVLEASHKTTLNKLKEGTPGYEEELQKYEQANLELNNKLRGANKEREANTKASNEILGGYFKDLFAKVGEYADAAVTAVSSVMDTWNMGLQVQIDDLNEQLEGVNEKYEEAQKQREDAVKNVEDIESQLQAATGGTAEALKSQLQDSMHARAEAEREEKRLAKEKEKLEADVAKKEKQMRRNDLISQIAQGIANTAQGVTKALGAGIPGIVMAAIIGAMGAMQVRIMTKQLTKLADGGEIIGPSHANGGVPIAGTNYEVEGGEFVVNRQSYGANANLVNFINDTPRAITAADLLGVGPGDTTPLVVADAGQASEDRIVEAIKGINFQPVVSVTDINDVSDGVVTVKDLAGF